MLYAKILIIAGLIIETIIEQRKASEPRRQMIAYLEKLGKWDAWKNQPSKSDK